MTENIYHIWLSLACGAGEMIALKLLNEFGSAENIYSASKDDLLAKHKFVNNSHVLDRLLDKDLGRVEKILEFCSRNNVSVLNCDSSLYPKRLKSIRSYPVVLYYKGRLIDIDDNLCITVVGTRKMSLYGKTVAYELGRELAVCGAVVVSGMAGGIDSASQKGCLFENGFTIAVLGCGIDVVYPEKNKDLMNKIIEKGLVMTEYPPHTEPRGKNFPVRNRIMTGLSQAVVVVEADNRSGALITARLALAEGRGVYSVPGNINSEQSRGTNRLIKDGAGVVTWAYDILSDYEHIYSHRINIENSKYYKSGAYRTAQKKPTSKDDKNNKINETEKQNKSEDIDKNNDENENAIVVEVNLKEDLSVEERLSKMNVELNETEFEVYKFFYNKKDEKVHPNDINIPNIPKPDIINTLTFLELYGLIESHPGDYFSVSN